METGEERRPYDHLMRAMMAIWAFDLSWVVHFRTNKLQKLQLLFYFFDFSIDCCPYTSPFYSQMDISGPSFNMIFL